MKRPPALNDAKKRRLALLEPRLRKAARIGDFDKAKRYCGQISNVDKYVTNENLTSPLDLMKSSLEMESS